jgi:hypothetical protein
VFDDDLIDLLDKRAVLRALGQAAKRHTEAAFAYADAKGVLARAAQDAHRAGMSVTAISDWTDLSRPTVYKLLRHDPHQSFVQHLLGRRD